MSAWLASHTGASPSRAEAETTSSVEETALAVDALATVIGHYQRRQSQNPRNPEAVGGVQWSCQEVPWNGEIAEVASKFPSQPTAAGNEACRVAIIRGVEFLLQSVDDGRYRMPWPIGFYFAKLWYHERLYPLIFTTTALGKYLRATSAEFAPDWPQ